MKVDGKRYSNAGFWQNFRFALIKLLAGKSVVMVNAHMQFAERDPEVVARVKDVSGGYFNNCCFPANAELMLQITGNKPTH